MQEMIIQIHTCELANKGIGKGGQPQQHSQDEPRSLHSWIMTLRKSSCLLSFAKLGKNVRWTIGAPENHRKEHIMAYWVGFHFFLYEKTLWKWWFYLKEYSAQIFFSNFSRYNELNICHICCGSHKCERETQNLRGYQRFIHKKPYLTLLPSEQIL